MAQTIRRCHSARYYVTCGAPCSAKVTAARQSKATDLLTIQSSLCRRYSTA